MKRLIPSPATVIATIALIAATTGGAYASGLTGGQASAPGLHRAVHVTNVPSIATSTGNNPNPDSGDPGVAGWYFSGNANGSAQFTDGALELTGTGVDGNTWQGGVGIAKAYDMPLSDLTALAYTYTVDTPAGQQAPTIHVTVTGLTNDSKFASGFSNLVLTPGMNGVSIQTGVVYRADGFTQSAKWYSTDEPSSSPTGGMSSPEPFSYFVANNPNAKIVQISVDNGGSSTTPSGQFDATVDGVLINGTQYQFGS